MRNRIEFIERYRENTEEEIRQSEEGNLPLPLGKLKYRRIYVRLTDIFCPKEIPESKKCCEIEFMDGSVIVVRENYDDVCIKLDDAEVENEDDFGEEDLRL